MKQIHSFFYPSFFRLLTSTAFKRGVGCMVFFCVTACLWHSVVQYQRWHAQRGALSEQQEMFILLLDLHIPLGTLSEEMLLRRFSFKRIEYGQWKGVIHGKRKVCSNEV